MAVITPQYAETNLIGRLDRKATTTATTLYVRFYDKITGDARTPLSTTKLFVIDKGSSSLPNQNYEIVLAGSHSTTNELTTLSTVTRGLEFSGTSLADAGKGQEHASQAEVGCVDVHYLTTLLATILDGTASVPAWLIEVVPTFAEEGIYADRVFADATARDAAITSPSDGMSCYNTSEGVAQDYIAGAWTDRAAGATPNGSTTVAGKFQEATVAQQGTATAIGSTGARLVPSNSNLIKTSSGAGDENKLVVLDSLGKGFEKFNTYASEADMIGGTATDKPANALGVKQALDNFSNTLSRVFEEDIDGTTTPQAVCVSSSIAENVEQAFTSGSEDIASVYETNFAAQTFTTDSAEKNVLTKVVVEAKSINVIGDLVAELYATSAGKPTGSALATDTISSGSIGTSYSDITATFDYGLVEKSTQYAIVLSSPTTTGTGRIVFKGSSSGGYAGGTGLTSSDSGSTWSIQASFDTNFDMYTEYEANGEILKAKADISSLLCVIGFVNTNVSKGDTGEVLYSNILDGFSGLSIGEKYYLDDNYGLISTTPGTTTVIVGVAISETELKISIQY